MNVFLHRMMTIMEEMCRCWQHINLVSKPNLEIYSSKGNTNIFGQQIVSS